MELRPEPLPGLTSPIELELRVLVGFRPIRVPDEDVVDQLGCFHTHVGHALAGCRRLHVKQIEHGERSHRILVVDPRLCGSPARLRHRVPAASGPTYFEIGRGIAWSLRPAMCLVDGWSSRPVPVTIAELAQLSGKVRVGRRSSAPSPRTGRPRGNVTVRRDRSREDAARLVLGFPLGPRISGRVDTGSMRPGPERADRRVLSLVRANGPQSKKRQAFSQVISWISSSEQPASWSSPQGQDIPRQTKTFGGPSARPLPPHLDNRIGGCEASDQAFRPRSVPSFGRSVPEVCVASA